MKNFVVNLDRQPAKYERFLKQNEGCGIAFERFSAFDGSQMTDQEVMAMGIVAPGSRFTAGAVGGAASMSRIWKLVAEQDAPALIFEDDCIIRHDINAQLARLLPSLGDWDLLVLGWNMDSILDLELVPGVRSISMPDIELAPGLKSIMRFEPQYPDDQLLAVFQRSKSQVAALRLNSCFGPGGYVLSPAGARKMFPLCFPMDNRDVKIEGFDHAVMTSGADGMGNSIYHLANAYVCFGPLVVPRNHKPTSTTFTHDARTWG